MENGYLWEAYISTKII